MARARLGMRVRWLAALGLGAALGVAVPSGTASAHDWEVHAVVAGGELHVVHGARARAARVHRRALPRPARTPILIAPVVLVPLEAPACTRVRLMSVLASIDPEASAIADDLASIRPLVCSGRGFAELERWPSGERATSVSGAWYYPDGEPASSLTGTVYYPNGQRAVSSTGTWYYPDGERARRRDGTWYLPDGTRLGRAHGAHRRMAVTVAAILAQLWTAHR